jgi:hypothetical protein
MEKKVSKPVLWIVGISLPMAIGFLFGIAFERTDTLKVVQYTITSTNLFSHVLDSYAYAVSDAHFVSELEKISSLEELDALKKDRSHKGACHAASAIGEAERLKTSSTIHRVALDAIISEASATEKTLGGCP